jgi:hypothetical protein
MPDECHDSVLNNDNKLLEDLYDTDFRSTFLLSLCDVLLKVYGKNFFFTGTYYMYVYLLKMTFWYLLL